MTISSLEQLHQFGLAALVPNSLSEGQLTNLPSAMHKLALVSLNQIIQLLADQQALIPLGDAQTASQIKAALNTAPRHEWLVDRWLIALTEHELLQRQGDKYALTKVTPCADVTTELQANYQALGFPSAMADAHIKVLASLSELLSDRLDINQVLFQQSSPLVALAAYQTNYFTAYFNSALAQYLTAQIQPGPMVKILELGGGTGLLTDAIFQRISGRPVQYQFTDVSALFTKPMQSKLRAQIGARCRTLDIDNAFDEQAVPPASLDFIVAGNVLHNAQHIGRTLKHIRTALKLGGQLLFTESIADNPAMLTAMQFLLSPASGHAMVGHADCRANSSQVFIDDSRWQQQLEQAGLQLTWQLPQPNSPLSAAGQALFIATAI